MIIILCLLRLYPKPQARFRYGSHRNGTKLDCI